MKSQLSKENRNKETMKQMQKTVSTESKTEQNIGTITESKKRGISKIEGNKRKRDQERQRERETEMSEQRERGRESDLHCPNGYVPKWWYPP